MPRRAGAFSSVAAQKALQEQAAEDNADVPASSSSSAPAGGIGRGSRRHISLATRLALGLPEPDTKLQSYDISSPRPGEGTSFQTQKLCQSPAPRTSGDVEAVMFDISSPRERGQSDEPAVPQEKVGEREVYQRRSMQALHEAKQEALSLSDVLARAKPSWTEQDRIAVTNKLTRIGVFDVVKLKEALAGDINQRLRDAGYKKFWSQETLDDLKRYLHLDEFGLPKTPSLQQRKLDKEKFSDRRAARNKLKGLLGIENFPNFDISDKLEDDKEEDPGQVEDVLEDKLELRNVVMVARPEWSTNNADVAVNKLKLCGVLNLQMLAEALSEGLNERMRKAGVRTFATSFLGALRVAVDEALAEKEKSTCIDTDDPSRDVTSSEDDDTSDDNNQNQKEGHAAGSLTDADVVQEKATASSVNADAAWDKQGKTPSTTADASEEGDAATATALIWSYITIRRTFIEAVEVAWGGTEGTGFSYGVEWQSMGGEVKTDEAAFTNPRSPATYLVQRLAPTSMVQVRMVRVTKQGSGRRSNAVDPVREVGPWYCAVTQPLMMWSTLSPALQIRAATDSAGVRRGQCHESCCSGYLHSAIFDDLSQDVVQRLCCFRCGSPSEQHGALLPEEELSFPSEKERKAAETETEADQQEDAEFSRQSSQHSQKTTDAKAAANEEPQGSSECISTVVEPSICRETQYEDSGGVCLEAGQISDPSPQHELMSGISQDDGTSRQNDPNERQESLEERGGAGTAEDLPVLVMQARQAIQSLEACKLPGNNLQNRMEDGEVQLFLHGVDHDSLGAHQSHAQEEIKSEVREAKEDVQDAMLKKVTIKVATEEIIPESSTDSRSAEAASISTGQELIPDGEDLAASVGVLVPGQAEQDPGVEANRQAKKKDLTDAIAAADIHKIKVAIDAARNAGVEDAALALGDQAITAIELQLLRAHKVTTCSICCEDVPAGGAALLSCPHGFYCKECMATHQEGSPECAPDSSGKGASPSKAESASPGEAFSRWSMRDRAANPPASEAIELKQKVEKLSPTEAKIQAAIDSARRVELLLLRPLEYEVVCSDPVCIHRQPHISSDQLGQLNKGAVASGFPGGGWMRVTWLPPDVSKTIAQAKLDLMPEKGCEANGEGDYGWIYLGMQLAARCLRIKVSERFADALDLRWSGLPGGSRPTTNYAVEWRPLGKASNAVQRALAAGGTSTVRQPHHCLIGLPVATTMRIRVIARISERDNGGVSTRVLGPWTEVATDNPTASFLSSKPVPAPVQDENHELEHLYVSSDWVRPPVSPERPEPCNQAAGVPSEEDAVLFRTPVRRLDDQLSGTEMDSASLSLVEEDDAQAMQAEEVSTVLEDLYDDVDWTFNPVSNGR